MPNLVADILTGGGLRRRPRAFRKKPDPVLEEAAKAKRERRRARNRIVCDYVVPAPKGKPDHVINPGGERRRNRERLDAEAAAAEAERRALAVKAREELAARAK